MKSLLTLVMSLCACAVAADTIKPLFETDSVAVYNRWLWRHREEYPNFRPVRALAGEKRSNSGWVRETVVFLTDSGPELMRYVYPDSWDDRRLVRRQVVSISVTEDGNHIAVHHRGGTTAYDRSGRQLFQSRRDIVPRFGLWFRDARGSDSTHVLDNSGKVLGVLPRISIWYTNSFKDSLIAAVSDSGVVVFDRGAKVRWQGSMFRSTPRVATISPDGQRVAIVTGDSVGLHDLTASRDLVLGFDSAGTLPNPSILTAWSSDSRRIAVCRVGSGPTGSTMLSIITGDGEPAFPSLRLEAGSGVNLSWTGDTAVLIALARVPDRAFSSDKLPPLGPYRVTAVTPSGGVRTWTVKGRFGSDDILYQQGRRFAAVGRYRGYAAVFQLPMQ